MTMINADVFVLRIMAKGNLPFGEAGDSPRTSGSIRDIADRKRLDSSVDQTEDLCEKPIRKAAIGTCVLDREPTLVRTCFCPFMHPIAGKKRAN